MVSNKGSTEKSLSGHIFGRYQAEAPIGCHRQSVITKVLLDIIDRKQCLLQFLHTFVLFC